MDISGIKLDTMPVSETAILESVPVSDIEQLTSDDAILCQNCGLSERMSSQAFLCRECHAANKKGAIPIQHNSNVVEMRPLDNIGSPNLRSVSFAPVSMRYAGKQLDEIAYSMLPAIPEELKVEIHRAAIEFTREYVTMSTSPTIQDIDCTAMFCLTVGGILQRLSEREKDKIVIRARPELKRQEKERKDEEKISKIQKSLPNSPFERHTANVILKDIATFEAPVDKALQATLKKFLDYVSLQSQIIESIDKAWIEKVLSTPMYSRLKQYIKLTA